MPREDIHGVGDEPTDEYVPAVYAESLEEAQWYQQLLADHGVPAEVDEDYDSPVLSGAGGVRRRVAVLVPEAMLAESREFIAELDDIKVFVEEDEDLDDEDDFEVGFRVEGEEDEEH